MLLLFEFAVGVFFIAKQKEEREANFRRCLFNEWPVASSSFLPADLFFFLGALNYIAEGKKKEGPATTTTRDIRDSVQLKLSLTWGAFGPFLLLDVSTRVRWRSKETGNDEANDLFRLAPVTVRNKRKGVGSLLVRHFWQGSKELNGCHVQNFYPLPFKKRNLPVVTPFNIIR